MRGQSSNSRSQVATTRKVALNSGTDNAARSQIAAHLVSDQTRVK